MMSSIFSFLSSSPPPPFPLSRTTTDALMSPTSMDSSSTPTLDDAYFDLLQQMIPITDIFKKTLINSYPSIVETNPHEMVDVYSRTLPDHPHIAFVPRPKNKPFIFIYLHSRPELRGHEKTVSPQIFLKLPHHLPARKPRLVMRLQGKCPSSDQYRIDLFREEFQKIKMAYQLLQKASLPAMKPYCFIEYTHNEQTYFEFYVRYAEKGQFPINASPELIKKTFPTLMRILIVLHPHMTHCDVKPANICLTQDDDPILIDFGRAYTPHGVRKMKNHGTPLYKPPEVVISRLLTPKFDVWSLAVTLWMVTLENSQIAPLLTRHYRDIQDYEGNFLGHPSEVEHAWNYLLDHPPLSTGMNPERVIFIRRVSLLLKEIFIVDHTRRPNMQTFLERFEKVVS